MTRINCIPVSKLKDKHLLAEYREMLRYRHAYPRKCEPSIPKTYRMGTGHVSFFWDKGFYLLNRHKALKSEMIKRGMKPNLDLDLSQWPIDKMGDWTPTVDSQLLNIARIIRRLEAWK